jgi:hypothetical protein
MNRVYLTTGARRRGPDRRGLACGLWAVVVLVTSAADHYLAALFGAPPLAWCTRQIAAVVRDAYRQGRFGPPSACTQVVQVIYDAEVIDDPADAPHPDRKDT